MKKNFPLQAPGKADAHLRQVVGTQARLAGVTQWLATVHAVVMDAPRQLLKAPIDTASGLRA